MDDRALQIALEVRRHNAKKRAATPVEDEIELPPEEDEAAELDLDIEPLELGDISLGDDEPMPESVLESVMKRFKSSKMRPKSIEEDTEEL